jgi:hypothetical protein
MATTDLEEAAKVIEELTGVPPPWRTRTKKQEQAARVKRFLALPPQLQEGILRYGENIQKSYSRAT